jgi:hypothetical protein
MPDTKGWPKFDRHRPGTRPEEQDRTIHPLPPRPVHGQDQYDDADPNDRFNT